MDDEGSSKRSWDSEDSDESEEEEPVERKPPALRYASLNHYTTSGARAATPSLAAPHAHSHAAAPPARIAVRCRGGFRGAASPCSARPAAECLMLNPCLRGRAPVH